MGNHASSGATGKIVHWDGSVQEFHKPMSVAELMLEHPHQVVVEFHSAVTQRRPAPLPADNNLDANNVYLMLPMKPGKPLGLNAQHTRRFLMILNSALRSKSLLSRSSRFLPWLARTTCDANAVTGQVMQKKEEMEMEMEMEETEERDVFSEYLSEASERRPEYLSREFSGKGWKPSLDTITEKKIETKITHWLFFKAF